MTEKELVEKFAGPPLHRQNRRLTDAERAEEATYLRQWEARAHQARLDLAAALEARDGAERAVDEAERAVDRALVAALDLNRSEPVRQVTGLAQATFWRRVKAARDAVGE